MLTLNRRIGRLIEVRVESPVTLADIGVGDAAMSAVAAELEGKGVICADYTQTLVLPEHEAAELIAMFRRHNDSLDRSAVLVSERSATAILQMERVIREASLPNRRAFRDAGALVQWLSEVLTPSEVTAAQTFLMLA